MEEGKEAEENSTANKTMATIERDAEEEREESYVLNELNELPEDVLLHIMKFMDTKHAVQTCVLSKRWKNIWKQLKSLSISHQYYISSASCCKFVSALLSNRDGSIPLHKVDMKAFQLEIPTQPDAPKLLDMVTKYVVLHGVQQMNIAVNLMSDRFIPLLSSCQSLTHLKLGISSLAPSLNLPRSLELPTLKSLDLQNFSFGETENDCAEPFSSCNSLNTLVIEQCCLQENVKVLCISNSNLCSLTLCNTILKGPEKTVLSTPNLRSLSVLCDPIHELSAWDLSFLKIVNIDITSKTYFHSYYLDKSHLALIGTLQVLADYVKTLILSSSTLEILDGLLTSDSMKTHIPSFVQLKSLKLKMQSSSSISDKGVSRILASLLQKSSVSKVDVINC